MTTGPAAPSAEPRSPATASPNRRELKVRSRAWPHALARWLARTGATPNQISVLSVLYAGASGVSFWVVGTRPGATTWIWLLGAAAGIQLRLLCNLLDGLLAIEGGMKSRTGELYNEVPDRIADVLILLGAGAAVADHRWGVSGMTLGVSAALLAVLTAYVRLLGGSLGLTQDFRGPMAKQHRMFTLTVGALAAAIEFVARGSLVSLFVALAVIVAGSALTFVLRLTRIARALEAR